MARKRYRMQTQFEVDWVAMVGRKLRRAREEKGYTQKQLAIEIETTQSELNRAENGVKALPLFCFYRACVVLGKDANSMMGRKRKKSS